jgi:acyl carrier protein
MTREEIIEKLRSLMKQTAEAPADWDAVTEETTIESLGFDSLTILDLIYDVQHAFGAEFDAEELVSVKTVGELTTFLQAQTG